MALYRPDYKLIEATKIIKNLGDSEEHQAIKYYVQKDKEHISMLNEKLKEYDVFFEMMDKFLPKSGMNTPLI